MLCCFVVLHPQDYELSYFIVTLEEPSYSPPPFIKLLSLPSVSKCWLWFILNFCRTKYPDVFLSQLLTDVGVVKIHTIPVLCSGWFWQYFEKIFSPWSPWFGALQQISTMGVFLVFSSLTLPSLHGSFSKIWIYLWPETTSILCVLNVQCSTNPFERAAPLYTPTSVIQVSVTPIK